LEWPAGPDETIGMSVLAWVTAAIGVVTFAGAGQLTAIATGHSWGGGDRAGHDVAARHRPAACPLPAARVPSSVGSTSGGAAEQVVSVAVPPTAFLDTDARGKVVSATTNTGCPPRPTDDLWYRAPDGTITEANPSALRGSPHWYPAPGRADTYVRDPSASVSSDRL
jgi:hypothetical protein